MVTIVTFISGLISGLLIQTFKSWLDSKVSRPNLRFNFSRIKSLYPKEISCLSIEIENHSSRQVFISEISILLADNMNAWEPICPITGKPFKSLAIESGRHGKFFFSNETILKTMGRQPVLLVKDELGHEYREPIPREILFKFVNQ